MSDVANGQEDANTLSGADFGALFKPVLLLVGRGILATLVALVALELGLRAFGLPTGFTRSIRSAYDLDDETLGPFRAGAQVRDSWPVESAYSASFNSLGFRGPEPRESAAPPILCVGDSITFGLGVEDDQSWPAYLDRKLGAAGLGRGVHNMGSGFLLIDDNLRYLRRALPGIQPGLVIFLAQADGYVIDLPEGALTPHEKSKRDERRRRVWPASWYHQLAIYEARGIARLWRKQLSMIGSGDWPPRLPATEQEGTNALERTRERFERRLSELQELTQEHGARLVLVCLPRIEPLEDEILIETGWCLEAAARLGYDYVDLQPVLEKQPDREGLFQYPYDFHFSPRGNEVVAEGILSSLRAAELLGTGR